MKITVTDGKASKSGEFKSGTRAAQIIAELGFGFSLPCGGKGRCGKCRCKIGEREALACQTPVFSPCEIKIPHEAAAVLTAESVVEGAEGTVIDIGTTTVAAAEFKNGAPARKFGTENPQRVYGGDVISRIGAKDTRPLTESITALVREIRKSFGGKTVITGNTAMLALLTGRDTSEMGVYPFAPPSLFDEDFEGAYLPPCVSAFVGADALCSLLWSGAAEKDEISIVADLGTNGEIFLIGGGKILCASSAAGPALEGAGIEYGMTAGEGAICHVESGGYEAMGGGKPKGICAGGLVDAVALMLDKGVLDEYGTLERDFEIFGSGIFITQADIRAFQLCKAAVAAAVKALLKKAEISLGEVDKIYLSGALGQGIKISSAVKTGLLPRIEESRFVPIGNGALLGGAMLLSEKNKARARFAAADCRAVSLGTDGDFAEMYINEMNFQL